MNEILIENQKKRLNIRLPLLLCFSLFSTWQMGIIYFSGTSLSLDGRTPLSISLGSVSIYIVLGYILSILFISLFPKLVVSAERIVTSLALLSALGMYLPLTPTILAQLYYFQCFCCVFMIGFETSLIVNLFSEETGLKHLLIAYPFASIVSSFLQNDFIKVPFSSFRFITIICLIAMLIFFFKQPTNVWPQYVKKADSEARPKNLSIGIYALTTLGGFITLFGTAVAENITHGIFVAFISSALFGISIYVFCKKKHVNPLRFTPMLIGISSLGFVFAIISLHVPSLSLVSCGLLGAGLTSCYLNPFYGIILAKRYPSRFISPIIIALAFFSVIVQMLLIEIFRDNTTMLYIVYLVISTIMAIVYLTIEPYLIHSFNWEPLEQAENPVDQSHPAEIAQTTGGYIHLQGKETLNLLDSDSFSKLSRQELRIAELIIHGYTNSEMAKLLYITENTVKSYRKTLYSKLHIHSKRELFDLATNKIPTE